MSGTIVLILRILLSASLYAFIGTALYFLWRDFQRQGKQLSINSLPRLGLRLNTEDSQQLFFTIDEITIGRDPSCDYSLNDKTVSARHARLTYHQGQWWVEDMGSTNGTFLNYEAVQTPIVITSGDELRCGQVVLIVNIDPSS